MVPDGVSHLSTLRRVRPELVEGRYPTACCGLYLLHPYLHPAHGAAPPEKMYDIKYTTSEISTAASQFASPAISSVGRNPRGFDILCAAYVPVRR